MAPATKNLNPISASNSWALPIAATILVAGSLLFWSCLGLLWLATRQSPQQPIVIWMPPATSPNATEQPNPIKLQAMVAPEAR
jgi:hypothetical protein